MRAWTKMTNDELVIHLDLWLAFSDADVVLNEQQKEFFREVMFRLQLMETRTDDGSSR